MGPLIRVCTQLRSGDSSSDDEKTRVVHDDEKSSRVPRRRSLELNMSIEKNRDDDSDDQKKPPKRRSLMLNMTVKKSKDSDEEDSDTNEVIDTKVTVTSESSRPGRSRNLMRAGTRGIIRKEDQGPEDEGDEDKNEKYTTITVVKNDENKISTYSDSDNEGPSNNSRVKRRLSYISFTAERNKCLGDENNLDAKNVSNTSDKNETKDDDKNEMKDDDKNKTKNETKNRDESDVDSIPSDRSEYKDSAGRRRSTRMSQRKSQDIKESLLAFNAAREAKKIEKESQQEEIIDTSNRLSEHCPSENSEKIVFAEPNPYEQINIGGIDEDPRERRRKSKTKVTSVLKTSSATKEKKTFQWSNQVIIEDQSKKDDEIEKKRQEIKDKEKAMLEKEKEQREQMLKDKDLLLKEKEAAAELRLQAIQQATEKKELEKQLKKEKKEKKNWLKEMEAREAQIAEKERLAQEQLKLAKEKLERKDSTSSEEGTTINKKYTKQSAVATKNHTEQNLIPKITSIKPDTTKPATVAKPGSKTAPVHAPDVAIPNSTTRRGSKTAPLHAIPTTPSVGMVKSVAAPHPTTATSLPTMPTVKPITPLSVVNPLPTTGNSVKPGMVPGQIPGQVTKQTPGVTSGHAPSSTVPKSVTPVSLGTPGQGQTVITLPDGRKIAIPSTNGITPTVRQGASTVPTGVAASYGQESPGYKPGVAPTVNVPNMHLGPQQVLSQPGVKPVSPGTAYTAGNITAGIPSGFGTVSRPGVPGTITYQTINGRPNVTIGTAIPQNTIPPRRTYAATSYPQPGRYGQPDYANMYCEAD